MGVGLIAFLGSLPSWPACGAHQSRRAPIIDARDPMGKLHFPGYSEAAAKLLVVERKARGLGIDTLSMDRGLSRDFAVHHVVNGAWSTERGQRRGPLRAGERGQP